MTRVQLNKLTQKVICVTECVVGAWVITSGVAALWFMSMHKGEAVPFIFAILAILIGGALLAQLTKLIDRGLAWNHQRLITNNPLYPNVRSYLESSKQYSEYLDALREQEHMRERAREEELRTKEGWWKRLDGREFEKELVELFRQRGYQVRWTGGAGDEGVDILLRTKGKTIVVQCKAHKNDVSPAVVRDLYGTLIHHKADEAWVIATGGFSSGARSFVTSKPIRLFTIRDILQGNEFAHVSVQPLDID